MNILGGGGGGMGDEGAGTDQAFGNSHWYLRSFRVSHCSEKSQTEKVIFEKVVFAAKTSPCFEYISCS